MVVGKRIRELREAAGLSARELGRLARLPSPAHVSLIEASDRPINTTTATALAAVLGCSLDYLVNGVGRAPGVRAVRASVEEARKRIEAA